MKTINKEYKIIDYISSIALLVSLIFPAIFYSHLPDQIPIHFNATGQADNEADKITLWIIPILGFIFYFGLFKLEKYLTTERAGKETMVAQKILKILNLIISLSFSYITVQIVLTALNKSEGLGFWFIYVFTFSMIFFPFIPILKNKK